MSGFSQTCECGRRALPGSPHCARHQRAPETQAERVARQPWRREYEASSYRRNRARAWLRSGHQCENCSAKLTGGGFVCDHVVALSAGGTNDAQNLQILCRECHTVKTREDRRARAERHRTPWS